MSNDRAQLQMNQTECAEMCANIARYFEDRMAKAAEAGDLTKTRDFSLRALTAWDCARSIQIGQMDDSADVFAGERGTSGFGSTGR